VETSILDTLPDCWCYRYFFILFVVVVAALLIIFLMGMLWAVFLGSAFVLGCWQVVVRFLQSEYKNEAVFEASVLDALCFCWVYSDFESIPHKKNWLS
jgi:hypothetical protein